MKNLFLLLTLLLIAGSCKKDDETVLLGNWTKRPGGFEGGSRMNAATFTIQGKGYIALGYNASNRLKGLWQYSPEIDQWTSRANFTGEGRNGALGFSIGNKGYVGMGYGDVSDDYLSDLYEYDPEANAWTRKADFPGGARKDLVAFSIGDKAYVGTGYGYDPEVGDGKSALKYFNDLWEFDPAGVDEWGAAVGSWRKVNGFPGEQRSSAVAFVIDGKGYVGTGISSSGSYPIDFYEFDPAAGSTGKWSKVASLESGYGRQQATGFAINGKGYLATGVATGSLKDCWEYSPASNAWTQKHDFEGAARYSAAAFALGNYAYLGLGSGSVNDFWRFDPTATFIDSTTDTGDTDDPWQ